MSVFDKVSETYGLDMYWPEDYANDHFAPDFGMEGVSIYNASISLNEICDIEFSGDPEIESWNDQGDGVVVERTQFEDVLERMLADQNQQPDFDTLQEVATRVAKTMLDQLIIIRIGATGPSIVEADEIADYMATNIIEKLKGE